MQSTDALIDNENEWDDWIHIYVACVVIVNWAPSYPTPALSELAEKQTNSVASIILAMESDMW